VRGPSSANGIVGLKPTLGLLSRDGIVPLALSFDTAGPMTRSVADLALALNVLAAVDPADTGHGQGPGPTSMRTTPGLPATPTPSTVRASAWRGISWAAIREVDWTIEAALETLRQAGATVGRRQPCRRGCLSARGQFYRAVRLQGVPGPDRRLPRDHGAALSEVPGSGDRALEGAHGAAARRLPCRIRAAGSSCCARTRAGRCRTPSTASVHSHALPLVREIAGGAPAVRKSLDAIVYPDGADAPGADRSGPRIRTARQGAAGRR
jgi:amidase